VPFNRLSLQPTPGDGCIKPSGTERFSLQKSSLSIFSENADLKISLLSKTHSQGTPCPPLVNKGGRGRATDNASVLISRRTDYEIFVPTDSRGNMTNFVGSIA
jgi:hypothetical protein